MQWFEEVRSTEIKRFIISALFVLKTVELDVISCILHILFKKKACFYFCKRILENWVPVVCIRHQGFKACFFIIEQDMDLYLPFSIISVFILLQCK